MQLPCRQEAARRIESVICSMASPVIQDHGQGTPNRETRRGDPVMPVLLQQHRWTYAIAGAFSLEVGMEQTKEDQGALEDASAACRENGIKIVGGKVRRTSSRFCLGRRHGDYNGRNCSASGPTASSGWPIGPTHKQSGSSAANSPRWANRYTMGNVPKPSRRPLPRRGAIPYGLTTS